MDWGMVFAILLMGIVIGFFCVVLTLALVVMNRDVLDDRSEHGPFAP